MKAVMVAAKQRTAQKGEGKNLSLMGVARQLQINPVSPGETEIHIGRKIGIDLLSASVPI